MNTSSLNINVLNYLLEKLEHRTRSILKKKAKYTEQPSIPTNEFLLFITEVQDDLKQSIAVIKKLLQDNKQMETIYLNQTLSNSQGDVNKVISDLKQDNNCLIAEIENLKLQLMYNNTNNSNHIDYNKEYHSYSRKEDVKNMKDVISDMKRNKLQIKQEIKKHFSNNNSNNNSNIHSNNNSNIMNITKPTSKTSLFFSQTNPHQTLLNITQKNAINKIIKAYRHFKTSLRTIRKSKPPQHRPTSPIIPPITPTTNNNNTTHQPDASSLLKDLRSALPTSYIGETNNSFKHGSVFKHGQVVLNTQEHSKTTKPKALVVSSQMVIHMKVNFI
jgi:hypothetical protein